MVGLDSIIVLPILLLAAIVGAFIAVATIVAVEVASRACPICGVEFSGKSDLKGHMEDHQEFFDPAGPALKEGVKRVGKAA